MKTCSRCHTPKSLDEFVKDKRRSDGRGSWCLTCNKEYMSVLTKTPKTRATRQAYRDTHKDEIRVRNHDLWVFRKGQYKAAREKWETENRGKRLDYFKDKRREFCTFIDALKLGRPCLDCGEEFPSYVMEFDHVRGSKRFNLGKMTNHRREAVEAEIEKCDLVCCNCHRVRTQVLKGSSKIPKVQAFREWLNSLKNQPCKDCGRTFPHVAMDFDHVQGEKVAGIAQMWSWGRERVVAEIAKCDLVCANCHRVRTYSHEHGQEQKRAA